MMGGGFLHLNILQQPQLHRPRGEHRADIANHTGLMRSASHGQVWGPHKVADFVGRGGARARTQFSPLAATKTEDFATMRYIPVFSHTQCKAGSSHLLGYI